MTIVKSEVCFISGELDLVGIEKGQNSYLPLSVQTLSRVRLFATHGLQHARLPCLLPTSRACSNSCPLSQWWHPTISSSVDPFSSCPQSFPTSGSFPVSQLFTSDGQSIGASASAPEKLSFLNRFSRNSPSGLYLDLQLYPITLPQAQQALPHWPYHHGDSSSNLFHLSFLFLLFQDALQFWYPLYEFRLNHLDPSKASPPWHSHCSVFINGTSVHNIYVWVNYPYVFLPF